MNTAGFIGLAIVAFIGALFAWNLWDTWKASR